MLAAAKIERSEPLYQYDIQCVKIEAHIVHELTLGKPYYLKESIVSDHWINF